MTIWSTPVFSNYSHTLPHRRKFSKKEWENVTFDFGTVTVGCGTITLFGTFYYLKISDFTLYPF